LYANLVRKQHRYQQGVSLIEALIAMMLTCFCVLALARLQATLTLSGVSAKARTEAQYLGRQVLDQMATSPSPATFPAGSDITAALNTSYRRTWSVKAGPAGEATGNVVVQWTDARGYLDSVSLSSIVSKDVALNEGKLLQARGDYGFANAGTGTLGVPGSNGAPAPWTQSPSSCALSGSGYSCSVPYNWSGTVSAISTNNQSVSPAPRSYANVTVDVLSQDYTVSK
jgi:Tfp pilus assembly protein PilV